MKRSRSRNEINSTESPQKKRQKTGKKSPRTASRTRTTSPITRTGSRTSPRRTTSISPRLRNTKRKASRSTTPQKTVLNAKTSSTSPIYLLESEEPLKLKKRHVIGESKSIMNADEYTIKKINKVLSLIDDRKTKNLIFLKELVENDKDIDVKERTDIINMVQKYRDKPKILKDIIDNNANISLLPKGLSLKQNKEINHFLKLSYNNPLPIFEIDNSIIENIKPSESNNVMSTEPIENIDIFKNDFNFKRVGSDELVDRAISYDISGDKVKKISNDIKIKKSLTDLEPFKKNIFKKNLIVKKKEKHVLNIDNIKPNTLKVRNDIVNAVNNISNAKEVFDIPIYFVVIIGNGIHSMICILYKKQLYTFGYGYYKEPEVHNKLPKDEVVSGCIYTPDDILITNPTDDKKNKIIDIGILNIEHIHKINNYMGKVNSIKSEIVKNEDYDKYYNITSNYLFVGEYYKYSGLPTIFQKNLKNCATFVMSIFNNISCKGTKRGFLIVDDPMDCKSNNTIDNEKINYIYKLYIENNLRELKEILAPKTFISRISNFASICKSGLCRRKDGSRRRNSSKKSRRKSNKKLRF